MATELTQDVGRCSTSALQEVPSITAGELFSVLVPQHNAE